MISKRGSVQSSYHTFTNRNSPIPRRPFQFKNRRIVARAWRNSKNGRNLETLAADSSGTNLHPIGNSKVPSVKRIGKSASRRLVIAFKFYARGRGPMNRGRTGHGKLVAQAPKAICRTSAGTRFPCKIAFGARFVPLGTHGFQVPP